MVVNPLGFPLTPTKKGYQLEKNEPPSVERLGQGCGLSALATAAPESSASAANGA